MPTAGHEEDIDKTLNTECPLSSQALDEAFGKNGGPYLSGKEPCSQCLALAPRLYHISVATDRIKVSGSPIAEPELPPVPLTP